jgi:ligand-binding SRPBCC domain-containing protein
MKVYTIYREQFLPITLEEAWSFFSSPDNLRKITPPHMGFNILSISGGGRMYAGQIIRYKVKVLPMMAMHWVTEITHVREPFFFVDEQRVGPYALWHHQHHFEEVPGGVMIIDEVHYAIPFGMLGRLANRLFVQREVNSIFDYRHKTLEGMFSAPNNFVVKKSA